MKLEPTYYYFAPVATGEYNSAVGIDFHVAAASNKVLGVANALSTQRRTVRVVSCPITTSELSVKIFPPLNSIAKGIPISFLRSISVRGLNRIFASFEYLFFLFRNHKKKDIVILYNFFPEYILSALYLFLVGSPAHLDIEDAPRKDEKGLRGFSTRFSYSILSALCDERKITAAQMIGKKLKLKKYLSVSGVQFDQVEKTVLRNQPIKVLFGGAMMRETGVDFFCQALTKLADSSMASQFHFVVTGFGDFSKVIELKNVMATKLSIELLIDCTAAEYRKQLLLADIGLCLKIPNSGIGETTFPSKSIEISANGLLLIATKISDIPLIFDDSTALLLTSDSAECLFDALVRVLNNKQFYSDVAKSGQNLIAQKFSPNVVGADMVNFLESR